MFLHSSKIYARGQTLELETKYRKERLCAKLSRANKENVSGTAPAWERCLFIELPKPWASDVIDTAHFPRRISDLITQTANRGYQTRLQFIAPDSQYSVSDHTRIIFFSRPPAPFTYYTKEEFVIPSEQTANLIETLLENRDKLSHFDNYRQNTLAIRDFFVCTHGTRDVCCGSFGYPVYHKLRFQHAANSNETIRAWRTSHIGGHRLAPNVVDMPEGRFWGRVRENDLTKLVDRIGLVSDLARFYRGWAGLDSPFEQIAEREAFVRAGWTWTRVLKSGQLVHLNKSGTRGKVRINFVDPVKGTSGTYEATVEHSSRSVPSVGCLNQSEPGEVHNYQLKSFVTIDNNGI